MIHDASAVAERMTVPATDPREYLLAFYPKASIPPLDHVVATARPMIARVNHGVWIASCECGARGAPAPGLVVWLAIPFGFCLRCLNRSWGGGWRPVVVPPPADRAAIEAVLLCRPNLEDRNWEVHESIDDLICQNIEAGDSIPEAA